MNDDKISVIVPIYNVEKYLMRCIDSIINQTYKNLEIILVDDGSTDKSGKIIDEYKEKDNRIKIIHQKNGGLSDARNKGIELATGNYISFVDSDDFIAKDMMEYLLKLIKENNSDISVCNFQVFSEIKDLNTKKEENKFVRNYSGIEMLQILLNGNISYGDYAWNKLYLSKLFENIRYPVGKKMEDIGTTYKLYFKSKKVSIGSEKKYYYYQRSDSILGKNDIKIYQDNLELSKERLEFLKEKNIDIDFSKYNIDLICKIVELYKNCKTKDSKKYFFDKSYDVWLEKLIKENKVRKRVSLKQFIKIKIFYICIKLSKSKKLGDKKVEK